MTYKPFLRNAGSSLNTVVLLLALACTGFSPGFVARAQTTYAEAAMHSFQGPPNGGGALAGPLRDSAGNLYGTTFLGGTANQGVIYKVDPTGRETVMHMFTGPEGSTPADPLIRD